VRLKDSRKVRRVVVAATLAALMAAIPMGATAHASIPNGSAPRVRHLVVPKFDSSDIDVLDGNSWDGVSHWGDGSGLFLPRGVSWD
jgi:hypothetical protein